MTSYSNPTLRHHKVVSGMNSFTFNSREQYLQFRSDWREGYRALTKLIRETRTEMKDSNPTIRSSAQSHKVTLRRYAREMMEIMTEAKEVAAMQYASQKESITA